MSRPFLRHAPMLLALALVAGVAASCEKRTAGPVRVLVIGETPKLRDPANGPLSVSDAVLVQNAARGLVAFDASGNIVAGLAERWNVSDDGLSYIFRLSTAEWQNDRKLTAQQVARQLKREISARKNPLSDSLGAIEDIVAMTDRVLEIRLRAPRPNLLALLAQPEMAIIRDGQSTGPFEVEKADDATGAIRLVRTLPTADEEVAREESLLLSGAEAQVAVRTFAAAKADLVLGGSFSDLPYARQVKFPRGAIRFDPASGLFGLIPLRKEGPFAAPEARRVLSQALSREALLAAFSVPNLTPRATLLEPGLDGLPPPVPPAWMGTPLDQRLPTLRAQAQALFGEDEPIKVRIALPEGPGADLVLRWLQRDWGALGLTVERADRNSAADFRLIDLVAPSSSPAWFLRRFRCDVTPVCDEQLDELTDAARDTQFPAERYSLFAQAAAIVDRDQLFIPITAPIRWSLVSSRIRGFFGNRYARHTLSNLQQGPDNGS